MFFQEVNILVWFCGFIIHVLNKITYLSKTRSIQMSTSISIFLQQLLFFISRQLLTKRNQDCLVPNEKLSLLKLNRRKLESIQTGKTVWGDKCKFSWSSKLRNTYLILGLLFHYNNCIQHQTISKGTDFALFNTCVKFVFFLISGSIWHTPDYIKQTLTCIPSE